MPRPGRNAGYWPLSWVYHPKKSRQYRLPIGGVSGLYQRFTEYQKRERYWAEMQAFTGVKPRLQSTLPKSISIFGLIRAFFAARGREAKHKI